MSFEEWWNEFSAHSVDVKQYLDAKFRFWLKAGWDAALKNQWQPIEICPLCTPVLCVENGVPLCTVFILRDDGVFEVCGGDLLYKDLNPTHWMLIPEFK